MARLNRVIVLSFLDQVKRGAAELCSAAFALVLALGVVLPPAYADEAGSKAARTAELVEQVEGNIQAVQQVLVALAESQASAEEQQEELRAQVADRSRPSEERERLAEALIDLEALSEGMMERREKMTTALKQLEALLGQLKDQSE